jgi:mannose-6-phosphate isomerase-like protein (cupin superfamily)
LVGDDEGSTPVRIGIQTSPPGYSTGTHSHPYMEVITVIEGTGEAWIEGEGDGIPIGAGSTMIAPRIKRMDFEIQDKRRCDLIGCMRHRYASPVAMDRLSSGCSNCISR